VTSAPKWLANILFEHLAVRASGKLGYADVVCATYDRCDGLPRGYDKLVVADIIVLLIEALKGIGGSGWSFTVRASCRRS
jgi:hypothetical protein